MCEINYTSTQIVAMSDAEIKKLGKLFPKKVYYQMETSGSPSVWTDNGEYLAGYKGEDIVRCAMEIRSKHAECEEFNKYFAGNWRYDAHIRVVF